MNKAILPVLAAGLGISLIAGSFVLSGWVPGSRIWPEEEAREYTTAGLKLHRLSYEVSRWKDREDTEARRQFQRSLEIAQHRYDTQRAKLDTARHRSRRMALWIKWIGVLLALAGIFGHVSRRVGGK